jgi:hypothetical protein
MVTRMLEREPDAMEGNHEGDSDRPVGQPEEIASAVLWLCGEGAGFVIGHALVADGAYTVR